MILRWHHNFFLCQRCTYQVSNLTWLTFSLFNNYTLVALYLVDPSTSSCGSGKDFCNVFSGEFCTHYSYCQPVGGFLSLTHRITCVGLVTIKLNPPQYNGHQGIRRKSELLWSYLQLLFLLYWKVFMIGWVQNVVRSNCAQIVKVKKCMIVGQGSGSDQRIWQLNS